MKKFLLVFSIICLILVSVQKSFVFAEDKTFQVVYSNSILKNCIDEEKFIEYRKSVEKYYLKKNAKELDEDFTRYMTPACMPYAIYIKDFNRLAQRHYLNVLKNEDLPLSVHFRLKVNRLGDIEEKYNTYCHSYETFEIFDAENEECKRASKIIDGIKLPKFDRTMEYDYLIFDTNFLNFNSDTKPPKVISSMPVGFETEDFFENQLNEDIEKINPNKPETEAENSVKQNKKQSEIQNNRQDETQIKEQQKLQDKEQIKPIKNQEPNIPSKYFEPIPSSKELKQYYDRLFYRQN